MTPHDTDDRQHIRRLLHARRHRLVDTIDAARKAAAALSDDVEGLEDRSSEESLRATTLELAEIYRSMLKAIDEALARLDQGTYGKCQECGRDIAEARLAALPFAARCQACQAVEEAKTPIAGRASEDDDGG